MRWMTSLLSWAPLAASVIARDSTSGQRSSGPSRRRTAWTKLAIMATRPMSWEAGTGLLRPSL